jgi:hypothetical protein
LIIAIKEKDRVVVGYSNTDYWDKLTDADYVDEENVPIKFTEDGTLISFAKMDRSTDIFMYDDEFLNHEITSKSIIRDVIPYMKNTLEKNNKPLDDEGRWNNALVICRDDKIYDLDTRFVFRESDDYICHAFSYELIQSVLDGTIGLPAEERILKAVSFVNKIKKENLFPLVIVDTKTKQFKHIMTEDVKYEYYDSL